MLSAKDLISNSVLPLKVSDSGMVALHWFEEFRVLHLPVINESQFLGLLSEEDVFSAGSFEEPIWNYQLQLQKLCIQSSQHIYEVLNQFALHKLSLLPVVDSDYNYLGSITHNELSAKLAETLGVNNLGGIIVLELNINDYSLAEIARISEENDTKILSLSSNSSTESTRMELVLKFDKMDIQPVVNSLLRYNYKIIATYMESEYFENLKDRYDLLMTYLNI